MSPLRFNTGLGFDYKYSNTEKKIDLSVMISPYDFRLTYINDTTEYVMEDGSLGSISTHLGYAHKQMLDYDMVGSRLKVDYRQQFNDYITLSSILSFYTNYKGIEVDWQIVGDFKLYKWLTARVSLNPRYDSTVGDGWGEKIQFKEFVSLGLAYRFEK